MEACLGRKGHFDEALWSPGHHITLSAWNAYENDALIRHEIAHDLGFPAKSHTDPRVLRCAGPLMSSLSKQAR